ncbi:glycosyltransferase family 4 protein [Elongatibacter sediminis]|uniref:Glycosyltransferase family 4 protein n=1 Tax=Elongatibacter sediminis TaxID=3119006 RepID=A0AAW9RDG5_9GAMM
MFGTAGLEKGSGGIAEWSREIVRTLLAMANEGLFEVRIHVLEGSGPDPEDDLFTDENRQRFRWYAGSRWRFAAGVTLPRADLRLFDHAGLARLSSMFYRARPYQLLIHGVELLDSARDDYVRAARRARRLIANSHYTARRVMERHQELPEIRVCWPGKRDPRSPRDAPAVLSADQLGGHALLIVGRLSAEQRHKGHDQLIEAMPLILRQVPDARLIVAGDGDDRVRLEHKARSLGVAGQVLFTGWVSEPQLRWLYDQCAVFVLPSDGDGFGLVFLEAMMARLPCVGLRSGAAAEIFAEGESGVLVDREDRSGMAEQLAGLLRDEPRRERLGQAAYQRYLSCFTAPHFAARLRTVLTS